MKQNRAQLRKSLYDSGNLTCKLCGSHSEPVKYRLYQLHWRVVEVTGSELASNGMPAVIHVEDESAVVLAAPSTVLDWVNYLTMRALPARRLSLPTSEKCLVGGSRRECSLVL